MKQICESFSQMHECDDNEKFQPILIGVEAGDIIQVIYIVIPISNFYLIDFCHQLNPNWKAEVIMTTHRTEVSVGFLLYNLSVSNVKPEISYLGDTSFLVFHPKPAHDHLLSSKILITELTYIEANLKRQEQARNYGHMSLGDFTGNDHIFKVRHIPVGRS